MSYILTQGSVVVAIAGNVATDDMISQGYFEVKDIPETTDVQELSWDGSKLVVVDKVFFDYAQRRKFEYPSMEEYLDAVVKGDQVAIQTYIDKCLAVKTKYPKPPVVEPVLP